jgi:hypothetical protein
VTTRKLIHIEKRFGETYSLHLQDWRVQENGFIFQDAVLKNCQGVLSHYSRINEMRTKQFSLLFNDTFTLLNAELSNKQMRRTRA